MMTGRTTVGLRILAAWLLVALLCASAVQADPMEVLLFQEGADTLSKLGQYLCGLGDINGDGFDDVAFSSDQPLGSYIFLGGNLADTTPAYFLRGGLSVASGTDMTGDGIPDLVVQATKDRLLLYRGFGDSIESVPSDSIVPSFATYSYGYSVTSGQISAGAIGDLVLFDPGFPSGGRAFYYENPFTGNKEPDWMFTNQANSHYLPNIDLIDFDGDGNLDIVLPLKADFDSVSMVYIFREPVFNSVPDIVIGDPIELDTLGFPNGRTEFAYAAHNIGDIFGDGRTALAIEYNGVPVIYFGGPSYDTLYDLVLDRGGGWPTSSAGDINGDGWNDFMCGRSQTWYGAVDVYLGGPGLDSASDYTIYESDFWPFPRHSIRWVGTNVASAGDFNGDGFDDLLIRNSDYACCDREYSSVYVMAGGPQITTGVEEAHPASLPETFALLQNYPNPFNPQTRIEFSLPSRSRAVINIYNVLGQQVRQLLDRSLAAGTHAIVWDGRDDTGGICPSGVYLYQLVAGDVRRGQKMVLLK